MVLTRFPTGGFTVAAVVNPPDEKVVNPTLCIGLIARGVAKRGADYAPHTTYWQPPRFKKLSTPLIVIQCYEVHQTA